MDGWRHVFVTQLQPRHYVGKWHGRHNDRRRMLLFRNRFGFCFCPLYKPNWKPVRLEFSSPMDTSRCARAVKNMPFKHSFSNCDVMSRQAAQLASGNTRSPPNEVGMMCSSLLRVQIAAINAISCGWIFLTVNFEQGGSGHGKNSRKSAFPSLYERFASGANAYPAWSFSMSEFYCLVESYSGPDTAIIAGILRQVAVRLTDAQNRNHSPPRSPLAR